MSGVRIRSRGLMGGAAWSPADLPGLVVWNEGDVGELTDVDGIYQWDPAGGSGLPSATQGTGSAKPAVSAAAKNGLDCVQFQTDDIMSFASIALTSFTILVAFSATVDGIVLEHSVDSNSNDGCYLYTSVSQTIKARRSPSMTNKNLSASWGSDGAWRIVRYEYAGTHATHKLFVNGSEQTLSDGVETDDPGTGTANAALFIGARSGLVAPITALYASLVVCSPILSAGDAALAESYLNAKWAVY